jgi:hypothetical protein
MRCEEEYIIEDTNVAEPCPRCAYLDSRVERCDTCPLTQLDHMRQNSRAGRLTDRVLQMEFSSERFRIDWESVTAEEARCLQILKAEREKYKYELWQREQQKDRER